MEKLGAQSSNTGIPQQQQATTFLDRTGFKYYDWEKLPKDDPDKFLNTLKAVLEDPSHKPDVRQGLLDIYNKNKELLKEKEHAVHEMIPPQSSLKSPVHSPNELQERLEGLDPEDIDFEKYGLKDYANDITCFYNGKLFESDENKADNYPFNQPNFFIVVAEVLTALKDIDPKKEVVAEAVKRKFIQLANFALALPEDKAILEYNEPARLKDLLGSDYKPPAVTGNGANQILQTAFILFALYLSYQGIAKPAYQWIRSNKSSSVRV